MPCNDKALFSFRTRGWRVVKRLLSDFQFHYLLFLALTPVVHLRVLSDPCSDFIIITFRLFRLSSSPSSLHGLPPPPVNTPFQKGHGSNVLHMTTLPRFGRAHPSMAP